MKAKEKDALRTITDAMLILPVEKREYMLGYAEGVIAMSGVARQEGKQKNERDSA